MVSKINVYLTIKVLKCQILNLIYKENLVLEPRDEDELNFLWLTNTIWPKLIVQFHGKYIVKVETGFL